MRFLTSICALLVFGATVAGCKPETEAATKAEVTAMRKRMGQLERRLDALEKRPNKAAGNKAKAGKSPTGKTGNKNAPAGKNKAPQAGKSSGKAPGKAPAKAPGKAPAGKSTGKAPGGKSGGKAGADG